MRRITGIAGWAWLGWSLVLTGGCVPQQPSRPGPTTLPSYVYPTDPPVVDEAGFRNFIARMDGGRTLVLVFRRGPSAIPQLSLLARLRNSMRARGDELVGLCLDPPQGWPTVAAMLRDAGANFPSAVADPGAMEALGRWLSGGPRPAEGLYLLDRRQRPMVRAWLDFTESELLQAATQPGPAR